MSSSSPEPAPQCSSTLHGRRLWIVIAMMVIAFAAVIWQRERIRAYGWVIALERADTIEDRAYYVACIASVGEAGNGAVQQLARHSDPSLAALVIPASQGLTTDERMRLFERLLHHESAEVALEVATAMVFCDELLACVRLIPLSRADDVSVALAATAGLARVSTAEATEALRGVLQDHDAPLVRAQAVESLAQQIRARLGTADAVVETAGQPADTCDLVTALVSALSDSGVFSEKLALEREIEAVSAAVTAREGARVASSNPAGAPRTVASVAAANLSDLTGHSISPLAPNDARGLTEQCCRWIAARAAPPHVEHELAED